MWALLAWLATGLGFGCVALPEGTDCTGGLPNQCAAEQMIWRDILGETGPAPPVAWVDETCNNQPGFEWGGRCLWGVHVWEPGGADAIQLVRRSWDQPIATSAYTHELVHAHLLRRDPSSKGDPGHTAPIWGEVEGWQLALSERGY